MEGFLLFAAIRGGLHGSGGICVQPLDRPFGLYQNPATPVRALRSPPRRARPSLSAEKVTHVNQRRRAALPCALAFVLCSGVLATGCGLVPDGGEGKRTVVVWLMRG